MLINIFQDISVTDLPCAHRGSAYHESSESGGKDVSSSSLLSNQNSVFDTKNRTERKM